MQSFKVVEQLFLDYCDNYPSTEGIVNIWIEILSFGIWRRKPIEVRLRELMQYRLQISRQLRDFIQLPDNRKDLIELVTILEWGLVDQNDITGNLWQDNFKFKAYAFTSIAKGALSEKSMLDD